MVESRPFQGFWKHFKEFDKKRSNQERTEINETIGKTTKEIMAIFVVNKADKFISKYLATTTTHFYTHT